MEVYYTIGTSFYERLVGLTKRALRKTIGSKLLTQRQLTTILTEVEAVINSRPLVYVSDDIDSSVTLSPINFLLFHSNNVIPDIVEDSDKEFEVSRASSSEKLLDIWKCGQRHLNEFWRLWKQEYLLSLRERSQVLLKGTHTTASLEAKVGDVLLLKEPRGGWKVGKICGLIPSRDQLIRSAKVTVGPCRSLKRPLNLLYPIECPSESVNLDNLSEGNHASDNTSCSKETIDDDDVHKLITIPLRLKYSRMFVLLARQ